MRRYGRIGAGLAAAALLASLVGAAPASASTSTDPSTQAVNVLTYNSVGGPNVDVGDVLKGTVASGTYATFYSSTTGTTGLKCATSEFTATVLTNPPAPGTATERLDSQTFTNCTSNVFGTTGVKSVTVNGLPYTVSVTSPGSVVINGPITSTVVLNTVLGTITCVYGAPSLTGTADNPSNSIMFVNQVLTKSSGPSTCFGTAYFTVKYSPVVDVTKGNAPVFVN